MNNAKDPLEWHALQHNAKVAVHETIAAIARQIHREKKRPDPDTIRIRQLREEQADFLAQLTRGDLDDAGKMEAIISRCHERIQLAELKNDRDDELPR